LCDQKTKGIFQDGLKSFPVQLKWGEPVTAFVRRRISHQTQSLYGREESSSLYQRGWAFQERLLSPRVLYYTISEVIWECRAVVECECGSIQERFSRHDRSGILHRELDHLLSKIPLGEKILTGKI